MRTLLTMSLTLTLLAGPQVAAAQTQSTMSFSLYEGCGQATAASTSVAASAFDRSLSFGTAGEQVQSLQQFLNDVGCTLTETDYGSPGNETTFFGPLTTQALRVFQLRHDLTASGYLGAETREFIQNNF